MLIMVIKESDQKLQLILEGPTAKIAAVSSETSERNTAVFVTWSSQILPSSQPELLVVLPREENELLMKFLVESQMALEMQITQLVFPEPEHRVKLLFPGPGTGI